MIKKRERKGQRKIRKTNKKKAKHEAEGKF